VGFAQSYPLQSVALTRLSEITRYVPKADPAQRQAATPVGAGASIAFREVTLVANQVPILRDLTLDIAAGEHVAIVGRSGSGKSSLLGLLLGFWKPSAGALLIDGEPYKQRRTELLGSTVWVDPSAQLWDSTIRDNVDYSVAGADPEKRRSLVETAELSDLFDVIDRMERGFDTRVGPEGSLISGGEGQRVRLARGLRRADVRLVALDEAFRGLDRQTRQRLTNNVRAALKHSTLLSVSHDIHAALDFPRVLVVEDGQVVEDGVPQQLAARESRFKQLLAAEAHASSDLWGDASWRRLRVVAGEVVDERVVA
jgi:ATP-binding cassette subfamily B protein